MWQRKPNLLILPVSPVTMSNLQIAPQAKFPLWELYFAQTKNEIIFYVIESSNTIWQGLGKTPCFTVLSDSFTQYIKEPFFFFGQDISIKVLELMWWPARWKILFSSVLRISRPVDKIIITSTKSAESKKAKALFLRTSKLLVIAP